MIITTLSSRELQQNASQAQKAAQDGPVFITSEEGTPAYVLLSIEEYRRITGTGKTAADIKGRILPSCSHCLEAEDIEFEIPEDRRAAGGRSLLMFVLDTNVISELRKAADRKGRSHGWRNGPRASTTRACSCRRSRIHELEKGILLAERKDPPQGAVFRAWLDGQVLPAFIGRILPVDTAVAQRMRAAAASPILAPLHDGLIAATALVHGMTVVTRNVADFAPTGVRLLNPWEPQGGSP